MKKIGIFCVGTGGHVLPAKNLITQLNDEGIDLDKFIIITDERGSQYLKNLDIKIYILDIYRSKIGLFGYVLNIYSVCLLYTSPSPRDQRGSRMASCA